MRLIDETVHMVLEVFPGQKNFHAETHRGIHESRYELDIANWL